MTDAAPPLTLPARALTLVEFPGYVRDPEAATAALGGREALAAAAADAPSASHYLAARLRRGDPLAHPLISARRPARGVLLRLAVPAASPDVPPVVTVVGVVRGAHHFPGMADAQYAPVDPRPSAGQPGRPPPLAPGALPDEPLLAVPPAFFRGDLPPADGGALPRWGEPPRGALPSVPFHAAHVPAPEPGASGGGVAATALGDVPVWAPAALAARDGGGGGGGGPALARAAYTFRTGPWAGLVVRRGYDPRADPGAAAWQAVRVGGGGGGGGGDGAAGGDAAPAADYAAVVALTAPPPPGGMLVVAADVAPALPAVKAALAAPRHAAADAVSGWVPAAAWAAAVEAAGRV